MTWVLIMALFVSQSYAYAFAPCESMAHTSDQHNTDSSITNLDTMDHSLHQADMANDMLQQEMAMDCCDQECSCLTGTCTSVTFTHFIGASVFPVVTNSAGFYLFSLQDAFLPSLRKPPINS